METVECYQGDLMFYDLEVGDMFYSQVPGEEDVLFCKFSNSEATEVAYGGTVFFNSDEPVLFAGRGV